MIGELDFMVRERDRFGAELNAQFATKLSGGSDYGNGHGESSRLRQGIFAGRFARGKYSVNL